MNTELSFFFQYLEKERIFIEKNEFLFQVRSHPDYPSLLSISDTLSFFNIDNGALKILKSEIDLLPEKFIALLNDNSAEPFLYLVERKENIYVLSDDNKKLVITKDDLEKKWCNVVLLVEKKDDYEYTRTRPISFILLFILFSLSLIIVYLFANKFVLTSYYFLSLTGLLMSVIALNDLFGFNSKIINSICRISSHTDCLKVIKSERWKIFKYINFSDLSIIFFIFQIVGFLSFSVFGHLDYFLETQKIILIFSLPLIIASVYYQKYIEKKWCPICISIILIVLLELTFLFFNLGKTFSFQFKETFFIFFIFFSICFLWFVLKKVLLRKKALEDFQMKTNRFIRDYDSFKKILISDFKITLPHYSALIGSLTNKTEIAVITNPFCGHCKDVHVLLNKILLSKIKYVNLKIVMNVDLENAGDEDKNFLRVLMNVRFNDGEHEFNNALKSWFENGNIDFWFEKYDKIENTMMIDEFYNKQYEWCKINGYYSTPILLINGYKYPKFYERNQLEFFINDIIEDDF